MENSAPYATLKPAGFFIRVLAALLDLAILVATSWVLGLLLIRTQDVTELWDDRLTIFVILSAAYSIGFWIRLGATPAKLLLGMRVVRMRDGERISWLQGLSRWISYVLSGTIFGAGFLMAAFHPLKRTIHDLMSGTRVVRISRRPGT